MASRESWLNVIVYVTGYVGNEGGGFVARIVKSVMFMNITTLAPVQIAAIV